MKRSYKKGEVFVVTTKDRTFQAKAAKAFSVQFDMIWPVYDLDRGGYPWRSCGPTSARSSLLTTS